MNDSKLQPEKDRTIRFGPNDFDPFFETAGIEPNTLTATEWRQFENMFMEGIFWAEVTMTTAETIAWYRNNS